MGSGVIWETMLDKKEQRDMDTQSLINVLVGASLAVAGWFGRELWTAVSELRKDLHRLEIDLPSGYIRRDEFTEGIHELKIVLNKIFDKLDGKEDKK